uniref:Variant-specific surface protein S6 n=1 Tax=Giardia intestinalis TaxID=5741 RepID=Q8I8W3_GIAIN|nr:variant-specific surface protein S6 [Giardia intestinalis]
MTEDNVCRLCSDPAASDSEQKNKGIAGCKACTKTASANPACTECLEGYIENRSGGFTCDPCAPGCATCSKKEDPSKCLTCKQGYFLKDSSSGECISCSDTTKGGIEGCAECTNSGTFKCTKCKVNYRPSGEPSTGVTCTKACEDDTACGGTAGACDAIVIDNDGVEHHYCSYCGDSSKYPIDGLCASEAQSNTCNNHVCESCTTGYFMYMNGCYKVNTEPGSLMCKTSSKEGVCTEAANNRYFLVPGATNAQQSVLACSNPLGTSTGTDSAAKAYVGIDGCSACTAPAGLSDGGMTPAVCTSCDSDKKPNKDGSGCVVCSDTNCKSCVMDGVCGECNSGFSLDNGKCVSSGANRSGLSTGAIAGISVAVVAVVGGLVGFLCWWFVCRGKA